MTFPFSSSPSSFPSAAAGDEIFDANSKLRLPLCIRLPPVASIGKIAIAFLFTPLRWCTGALTDELFYLVLKHGSVVKNDIASHHGDPDTSFGSAAIACIFFFGHFVGSVGEITTASHHKVTNTSIARLALLVFFFPSARHRIRWLNLPLDHFGMVISTAKMPLLPAIRP